MKRTILSLALALTILTTCVASGQQAGTPTTKPPTSPSELAVTMKALEDKLRSVGRVNWSESGINKNTGAVERKALWAEVVSVAVDPKGCAIRIQWQTSWGPVQEARYLEEISSVDVLTTQEYLRNHHRSPPPGKPDFEENVVPTLYSVVMTSWGSVDFKTPTRDAAEQIAALLREAIRRCSAAPVRQQTTGTSGPGLDETLSFVADKISSQGRVTFVVTPTNTVGLKTTTQNREGSEEYTRVSPNPTTCTLSMDRSRPGAGTSNSRLSLLRIGKIEVMSVEEAIDRENARSGHPESRVTVTPPTFVLLITTSDGDRRELLFINETLADRVAKAMVHAAELCGAGANKEPF
jgi:hypothetical protein